MKNLLLTIPILLMSLLAATGQGVKQTWITTNSFPRGVLANGTGGINTVIITNVHASSPASLFAAPPPLEISQGGFPPIGLWASGSGLFGPSITTTSAITSTAGLIAGSSGVIASGPIVSTGAAFAGDGSGLTNLTVPGTSGGTVSNATALILNQFVIGQGAGGVATTLDGSALTNLTGSNVTGPLILAGSQHVISATGGGTIVISNSTALDAASSLSVSNLTASRIVLSSAGKVLSSASASGSSSLVAGDGSGVTVGSGLSLSGATLTATGGGSTWVMQLLRVNTGGATSLATGNRYIAIDGSGTWSGSGGFITSESPALSYLPTTGYLSNFTVWKYNTFPATTNIVFTVRTNTAVAASGGISSTVTCTLLNGYNYTNDTTHSILLNANMVGCILAVPTATLAADQYSMMIEWWHQ